MSKPQKEFNRLTETIAELEAEIMAFRAATARIRQRIVADYLPLLQKYNQARAELVRTFDRAYDRPDTTTAERKKLADLILSIAFDLIDQHGLDELKAIYDKYDSDGFDALTEQHQPEQSDTAADPERLPEAATTDPIPAPGELMPATQERSVDKSTAGKRQAKPKTARQQARDARKELTARNITKAVRTLYMDLVKAFHPDREPDEAEKVRKTGIMQRVTEAYEKSDLLALLRLQLEFERIGQADLKNLADEPLTYYNTILRQQVDELRQELSGLHQYLAAISGQADRPAGQAIGLEFRFNTDLKALKNLTKTLKSDLNALKNPAQMKAFLKSYRIPGAGHSGTI